MSTTEAPPNPKGKSMTTPATRPSADELREQIEALESEIVDAERALGRATLDGDQAAVKAAAKRAAEARAAIERTEAAIGELERRQAEEAEEARTGAASDARRVVYEWLVEYAARVEAVLVAQAALDAANAHLAEHRGSPGYGRFTTVKLGMRTTPEDSDLDADALTLAPSFPKGKEPLHRSITIDSMRRLRDLAGRRAEEEARGEGQDLSGVPTAGTRERAEARQQRRAEIKAERERERVERIRELREGPA